MAVPPYRFRRAAIQHLPQLAGLFNAYRVFYGQESNLHAAEQFLRERLELNDTVIFIALNRKEEGCGFTQLFPVFTSVGMKRHWLLNDIYVAPDHRGEGIGEQLIGKAKIHARDTGAKGLFLQTDRTNETAQRLYDRCGFRKDEESFWYHWND